MSNPTPSPTQRKSRADKPPPNKKGKQAARAKPQPKPVPTIGLGHRSQAVGTEKVPRLEPGAEQREVKFTAMTAQAPIEEALGRLELPPDHTRLYHGTKYNSAYSLVQNVDLALCSPHCDFGQGFYLARQAQVALAYALPEARGKDGAEDGALLVFDLPNQLLKELNVFQAKGQDWEEAVLAFRRSQVQEALGKAPPQTDVWAGLVTSNGAKVEGGGRPQASTDFQYAFKSARALAALNNPATLVSLIILWR